jgi:hypothetical protein
MSFEAKRLRVQLPCDEHGTLVELGAGPQVGPGGGCHLPTIECDFGTCWFETPICDFPTLIACPDYISEPCFTYRTPIGCYRYWSPPPPPPCWRFHSCFHYLTCPPRSLVVEPPVIQIDPEQLPVLRERLEAQLKEIEKAEKELEKRKKDSE